jgi:hypothetical protein
VPAGKELSALSESYNIEDIPRKYGGGFDFEFGMPPSLDPEIRATSNWLDESSQSVGELPIGPMRWIDDEGGNRIAVAVGKSKGKERKINVMSLVRE